jgi:methionine-rich copper-binding protein CopC
MSALRFKQTLSCLSLLACLTTTTAAFAHAHLESELPAADSEVTTPKELRLTFSEGVEEKFTKVAISLDGPGQSTEIIQTQSVTTDPVDKKVLIVVPAMPLAPGTYKVEWHAVSVDTHKSEGIYRFKVTP